MARYYFDSMEFDRKMKLDCVCGWSGTPTECSNTIQGEDMDYCCPTCEESIAQVSLGLSSVEEVFE